MENRNLGVVEASQAIIVSKALKNIQNEHKLPPAQAIEYLTSSLTTMKLLGKVESQNEKQSVSRKDCSLTSNTLSFKQSTVKSITPLPTTPNFNTGSIDTAATLQSHTTKTRMSKSVKNNHQRQKEEKGKEKENHSLQETTSQLPSSGRDDPSDVDANVAQKVILQKSSASGTPKQSNIDIPSSPSITSNNRMKPQSPKVPREKRDLDCIVSGQPAHKRQRLDSI